MAAALIHESSRLNFQLNTGTVSEPKKTSLSISRISETATAEALSNVATPCDALFAHDVTGHKVSRTYALNLA